MSVIKAGIAASKSKPVKKVISFLGGGKKTTKPAKKSTKKAAGKAKGPMHGPVLKPKPSKLSKAKTKTKKALKPTKKKAVVGAGLGLAGSVGTSLLTSDKAKPKKAKKSTSAGGSAARGSAAQRAGLSPYGSGGGGGGGGYGSGGGGGGYGGGGGAGGPGGSGGGSNQMSLEDLDYRYMDPRTLASFLADPEYSAIAQKQIADANRMYNNSNISADAQRKAQETADQASEANARIAMSGPVPAGLTQEQWAATLAASDADRQASRDYDTNVVKRANNEQISLNNASLMDRVRELAQAAYDNEISVHALREDQRYKTAVANQEARNTARQYNTDYANQLQMAGINNASKERVAATRAASKSSSSAKESASTKRLKSRLSSLQNKLDKINTQVVTVTKKGKDYNVRYNTTDKGKKEIQAIRGQMNAISSHLKRTP